MDFNPIICEMAFEQYIDGNCHHEHPEVGGAAKFTKDNLKE